MFTELEKKTLTTPPAVPAAVAAQHQSWFQRRPIPVWIIFAWASLQMFAVLVEMSRIHYFEQISSGLVSPVHALIGFLFPALFFLGGLFLFMLRKVTILFFGGYLIWGVAKIVFSALHVEYLSLALVAGICIYSLRLAKKKMLR
jgi:hypothetical protein